MIVGIDCGGTGTKAIAYDGTKVLATAHGGVGNLKRIGYDGVVNLIESLCQELRKEYDEGIVGICIGIAGAGKQTERDKLRILLERALKVSVTVEIDAAIALHGAFDGGPGMLLIAGTGSIAFGKIHSILHPLRVGGWGWQVGDEGSGCWLGREAIRCALLAHDKRGEPTELTDSICNFFKIRAIIDVIPIIYSADWTAARFGELAPIVMDTSRTDVIARRLIRLAASHLARHLVVLQERLGGVEEVKQTAFSGGVIANPTALREELLIELKHIGTIEVVDPIYPPEVGAARMIHNS